MYYVLWLWTSFCSRLRSRKKVTIHKYIHTYTYADFSLLISHARAILRHEWTDSTEETPRVL